MGSSSVLRIERSRGALARYSNLGTDVVYQLAVPNDRLLGVAQVALLRACAEQLPGCCGVNQTSPSTLANEEIFSFVLAEALRSSKTDLIPNALGPSTSALGVSPIIRT